MEFVASGTCGAAGSSQFCAGISPLVPRVGLEPTPLSRTDFESVAATDYATEAGDAALAMCLRRGRIIT